MNETLDNAVDIKETSFEGYDELSDITPGTALGDKLLVLDSSKDITSINDLSLDGQLTCTSTTTGILPPRLTTTQRTAIASPSIGGLTYDTDEKAIYTYGSSWGSIRTKQSYTLQYASVGGCMPAQSTYPIGSETTAGTGILVPGFGFSPAAVPLTTDAAVNYTTIYEMIPDLFTIHTNENEWVTGWSSGEIFAIRLDYSTDGTTWNVHSSMRWEYDTPSTPGLISGTQYRGSWYASYFPRFSGRFSDMDSRPANIPANTILRLYMMSIVGNPVSSGSEDNIQFLGFYKIPNY